MKKFNFIFTGKYLKFWYIAFALTIGLMVLNYTRLRAVNDYTLYVYDNSGNVIQTEHLTRGEINQWALGKYPVPKLFVPNK